MNRDAMARSTFLLALCLVACGPGTDPTVSVQSALSEPTTQAIAAWEPTLTGCGRSLSVVRDDADVDVAYGPTTDGSLAQYQTHPHGPFKGGTIRVQPGAPWSEADLVHLLAHEFGHVLGAKDSDDPADLMWGHSNAEWPVVTAGDRAQVCR